MSSSFEQRALQPFLNDINRYLPTEIRFPLTQDMADTIGSELDSKLSPENLHEDGEITNAQADYKGRALMARVHSLRQYCAKNNLNTPEIHEAWN